MLKNIKFKNSTTIFIGIVLIIIGVAFGLYELYMQRKDKVFSNMNLLLYENEMPFNVVENDLKNEENDSDQIEKKSDEKTILYDYIGVLEIPKINLKRGFLDLKSKYNNVKYNVTLINGSTYPDEENNNLILAAHSGNCSICFFDKLFNLSLNDSAYVYYNDVKYEYKLTKTYEVEKTGTVAIYRDYSKKVLTLITCTKNSDTKQTVFIFELI